MTDNDTYVMGHLADALANDPRVGEQGLSVTVVGGRVYVRGEVSTPERAQAVAVVASEHCPDLELHNEVVVASYEEVDQPEDVTR